MPLRGGEGASRGQFTDERYRRLALRVVYFERPDALGEALREAMREGLRQRLMTPAGADVRWRSIPAAQREIEALIASGLKGDSLTLLHQYAAYLRERLSEIDADN